MASLSWDDYLALVVSNVSSFGRVPIEIAKRIVSDQLSFVKDQHLQNKHVRATAQIILSRI